MWSQDFLAYFSVAVEIEKVQFHVAQATKKNTM